MTPRKPRLTAPIVEETFGGDRQKYNEAVADGFIKCAPATKKGSTRTFSFEDACVFDVFANLLQLGLTPKAAGEFACLLLPALEQNPTVNTITLVMTRRGSKHVFVGGDRENPVYTGPRPMICAGSPVVFNVAFFIDEKRERFEQAVKEQREALMLVLGEDDGDE